MRPARLRPLFVVRAGGQRRDSLSVARDANEARGAGNDLRGDNLTVGAGVGAGETLAEGELVLAASALDPEIGSLFVRVCEVELRVEERVVAKRNAGRALAPPSNAAA